MLRAFLLLPSPALACLAVLAGLAALAGAALAAADAPYSKLADVLGTPKLAYSFGPANKSQLLLKFVPDGQNTKVWTKMTTVSILKVQEKDTDLAERGVIAKLKDDLTTRHAKIWSFYASTVSSPVTCYFEYTVDGSTQKGIVYSPDPGFVTVAQVGAKAAAGISGHDIAVLKSLIHR